MSEREPRPLKELLPTVLARLATENHSAKQLKPVWDEVVGSVIARGTSPLRLEHGALRIRVANRLWAKELKERERELVGRLTALLGPDTVSALEFEEP